MAEKYEINQAMLYESIRRQNQISQLIMLIGAEAEPKRISELEVLSKEISLVLSGFKCEKCGKTEELQHHHVIIRRYLEYVRQKHYLAMRNYHANIITFCKRHHEQIHKSFLQPQPSDVENLCITPEKISYIQKKYLKKRRKKNAMVGNNAVDYMDYSGVHTNMVQQRTKKIKKIFARQHSKFSLRIFE